MGFSDSLGGSKEKEQCSRPWGVAGSFYDAQSPFGVQTRVQSPKIVPALVCVTHRRRSKAGALTSGLRWSRHHSSCSTGRPVWALAPGGQLVREGAQSPWSSE